MEMSSNHLRTMVPSYPRKRPAGRREEEREGESGGPTQPSGRSRGLSDIWGFIQSGAWARAPPERIPSMPPPDPSTPSDAPNSISGAHPYTKRGAAGPLPRPQAGPGVAGSIRGGEDGGMPGPGDRGGGAGFWATGPHAQYPQEGAGYTFGTASSFEGAGSSRGKPPRRSLVQMAMAAFGGGYQAPTWDEEPRRGPAPMNAAFTASFKNLRTNPLAATFPGPAGAIPRPDFCSWTCRRASSSSARVDWGALS